MDLKRNGHVVTWKIGTFWLRLIGQSLPTLDPAAKIKEMGKAGPSPWARSHPYDAVDMRKKPETPSYESLSFHPFIPGKGINNTLSMRFFRLEKHPKLQPLFKGRFRKLIPVKPSRASRDFPHWSCSKASQSSNPAKKYHGGNPQEALPNCQKSDWKFQHTKNWKIRWFHIIFTLSV